MKEQKYSTVIHPGLGEDGKYHAKGDGNPLPEGDDTDLCPGRQSELR